MNRAPIWLSRLAIFLLLPLPRVARTAEVPAGYRISAAFELTREMDGSTGSLQVLEDERLTASLKERWRGADAAMNCESGAEPDLVSLCASIATRSLVPGTIRLIGASGSVQDERRFDRELIDVSPQSLHASARRTFWVTVDRGIGWGSYAGHETLFLEVKEARLDWLRAVDPAGKKSFEIRLMRSLKSDWRLVPSRGRPASDLLSVRCSPRETTGAEGELLFEIIFARYAFSDGRWVYTERGEPGLWESEDDESFPDETRFP